MYFNHIEVEYDMESMRFYILERDVFFCHLHCKMFIKSNTRVSS